MAEPAADAEPGAGTGSGGEAGTGAGAANGAGSGGAGTLGGVSPPAAAAPKDLRGRDAGVKAPPVDIHPPTRLERWTYGALRLLGFGLAKIWLRVEVHGTRNVPAHGPFVLAPVHRSNVDFLLASFVVRRRMRYMGKASIWKWSAPGRFFSMLGAFPVHRGSADRDALRTCIRVMENGEPLVMFPEGTRRSGPRVHELFDGAAYVAARTGVPLVPVGIGGSEEAMPHGAKFIKPHKVVLVVGEPIEVPRGDGTGRVPRRVVRELTEQLHGAIQACFDEARRRAGLPVAGDASNAADAGDTPT
ncbi:MAG TPA: lysophospholipid acyltransferase family protein [Acidimicrobiales bacterium]